MKKALKSILAFLLGIVMLFTVACNNEEWNYLHENLDKSDLTPAQFAEWMYNRTLTSIKLNRPNNEVVLNVQYLMDDYNSTYDYLDALESSKLASSQKSEHLSYYSLLSPVLVEHAKRTTNDEIWTGKSWREIGLALNMSVGGETMALIANQIMALNKDISTYPMYKSVLRKDVKEGEEIVDVEYEYEVSDENYDRIEVSYVEDGQTYTKTILRKDKQEGETFLRIITKGKRRVEENDTVKVKFTDAEKAIEIAKKFVDNAIINRPKDQLGGLYVIRVMYEFSLFIGYNDAYVIEEEYSLGDPVVPDEDEGNEGDDGSDNNGSDEDEGNEGDDGSDNNGSDDKEVEVVKKKIPIADYCRDAYLDYINS